MQEKSTLKSTTQLTQSSLEYLAEILDEPLKQVDHVIDEHLKSDILLIDQIAKHIIYAGGKRIRPSLTLASAKMFGSSNASETFLAAAVEFIHTATLLHDDVIDESDLRRGKPSAHQVWGNSASILVGDFLFARAFQLMVQTNHLSVLKILSHASATIAEGEVHQLVEAHNLAMTQETALKILGAKTAQLFGAACQTGAIVAGANQHEAQCLFDYGYNLGLVFQITDDVLDYTAQNERRGKVAGDDFREGKITLPVIYVFQKASLDEKIFMERTLVQMIQYEGDFEKMVELIHKYGAIDESLQTGTYYQNRAILALEGLLFEDAEEGAFSRYSMKKLLQSVAKECLEREV